MKKVYQKPSFYAETFQLVEHVASCNAGESITTVNYRDKTSCSYQDNDVIIFLDGVSNCQTTELNYDHSMFDSFQDYILSLECYNAFSDGNVFAS